MSIIDAEIKEIKKTCENVVPNSKIIACTPALIRINIEQTVSRIISVCLRFPANYPSQAILVEIKSKTLSSKFLDGLANLSEKKIKEDLGQPQVIEVLKFIQTYLRQNPICVAYDEVVNLKRELGDKASEQLKLRQSISTVVLTAKGGCYYYKIKAKIPEEYPKKCIVFHDEPETNLPRVLLRYLNAQSKEVARLCVEEPLRKSKNKTNQPFQPSPSLYKTLKFCINAIQKFYQEKCPICEELVLPTSYDHIVLDESKDSHVERILCGHLYHQGCLENYMNNPPFLDSGKPCLAKKAGKSDSNKNETCGERVVNERWCAVNSTSAESRWAQREAKSRELTEVKDFLI